MKKTVIAISAFALFSASFIVGLSLRSQRVLHSNSTAHSADSAANEAPLRRAPAVVSPPTSYRNTVDGRRREWQATAVVTDAGPTSGQFRAVYAETGAEKEGHRSGELRIYKTEIGETPGPYERLPSGFEPTLPRANIKVQFTDIDGDGAQDIVVTQYKVTPVDSFTATPAMHLYLWDKKSQAFIDNVDVTNRVSQYSAGQRTGCMVVTQSCQFAGTGAPDGWLKTDVCLADNRYYEHGRFYKKGRVTAYKCKDTGSYHIYVPAAGLPPTPPS
jgi:hypothetical protein